MGRIIAIINQKGGVGKTTTAINLAASLAVAERRTLVVDFDPQGNASSGLGVVPKESKTMYEALMGECSVESTICQTELPELYVIPSNRDLSGAEVELVNVIARERKLKTILEPLKEKFHYILIDCPPSLGLLTINALTAADSYLVPMQCEYFALEGLSQLMNTVGLIKEALNPTLEMDGVLLTMFDGRNNLSHQVSKEIQEHFGSKVFKTVIPRNIRLSEAPSHGKPIILYDIESKGSLCYLSAAKEIIEKSQMKQEPVVQPPPPPASTLTI